jgi:hypothetical protein
MNGCFPPLLCILLELVLASSVTSRRILISSGSAPYHPHR